VEVQDKYLPTLDERISFLKNRIEEYKRQMFGGTIEIKMADANGEKRNVIVTKDQMNQTIANLDIMYEELDKLEELAEKS